MIQYTLIKSGNYEASSRYGTDSREGEASWSYDELRSIGEVKQNLKMINEKQDLNLPSQNTWKTFSELSLSTL